MQHIQAETISCWIFQLKFINIKWFHFLKCEANMLNNTNFYSILYTKLWAKSLYKLQVLFRASINYFN